MRRQKWWIVPVIVCVVIIAASGAMLWSVNRGDFPSIFGRWVTGYLENQLGGPVHVDKVVIEGWQRISLQGVDMTLPIAENQRVHVDVPQVIVRVNPFRLMSGRGRTLGTIDGIHLLKPSVSVEGPAMTWRDLAGLVSSTSKRPALSLQVPPDDGGEPETPSKSVHTVEITVDGGTLTAALPTATVIEFNGTAQLGDDGVQVDRAKFDVFGGTGTLARATSTGMSFSLTGVDLAPISRFMQDVLPTAYSGKLDAAGRIERDGTVTIDSFAAVRGKTRLALKGTVRTGAVNLHVTAQSVRVPEDIPGLERVDIRGLASFAGTVHGTLQDPVLEGQVTAGSSHLWGQEVEQVRGSLELTAASLAFQDTEVRKDDGIYDVDGRILFAPAPDVPGQMDIAVQTRGGSVKALLNVLGSEFDADGTISGRMAFKGPFGHVGAGGTVTVDRAQFYGQRFDRIKGEFSLADGVLTLNHTTAELAPGRASADMVVDLERQALKGNVATTDWPLAATVWVKEHYGESLGGLVNISGNLAGTWEAPAFDGHVASHDLDVADYHFHDVKGDVRLDGGTLSLPGLYLERTDGGSYNLNGIVTGIWSQPSMDIHAQVASESLSKILTLGGLQFAVPIVQGTMQGSIDIAGRVDNPHVRLQLVIADAGWGSGRGMGLDLEIADRKVIIRRLG